MRPDEIHGDPCAEDPESAAQSADATSLDELFEHALRVVEAGEELGLEAWLAGREHLSDRAAEVARLAREVAVNVERPVPGALREVAGFEILHPLGRGSMASVYLARQRSLGGRLVALKVLPSSAALSPRARGRFVAEARALAKLRHAHVVTVHDVVESGDLCAYAMEWIEGATLAQVIAALREERSIASIERILGASSGALAAMTPTVFLCRLGIAIARALGAVHRAGLLHRDVKPSNILLRRDGTPVLSDFGLVRESESEHFTRSGQYVGTPSYSAPEQLRGDLDAVDPKSDVYSLGVTLYEALALRLPYSGRSPAEILARSEAGIFQPLRKLDASLPRDLETIVAKTLDPDREERYASADELADDLERLLALQPIHARPASILARGTKWARRDRRSLAAAALAALLVAIPVTWLARRAIERAGADDRARAALARAQQALLDPENLYPMFVVAHGNNTQRMPPASERVQAALGSYDQALGQSPSAALGKRIELERDVVALSAQIADGPALPSARLSESCPLTARVAREWHAQATGARASRDDIGATHLEDRRQLGLLAFLLGEAGLSIDAWRDVSLAFPADPLADASLGELHLERGEPELAYPRLLRACDAYPDAGFLVVELADAAAQLGELDVAERLLARAETRPLSNDYDGAVLIRADIAAGRGDDARAEELYRWMIDRYQRTSPYQHYADFLRSRGRFGEELAMRGRLVRSYSGVEAFRRKLIEAAELWWRAESEASVVMALRRCLDEPYREFGSFHELLDTVLDSPAPASGSGNDKPRPEGSGNARDSMLPPGESASGSDSGHSLRWLASRIQTHFQPEEYAPMFPFFRSLYCRALLGEKPELTTASIAAVDGPIHILTRRLRVLGAGAAILACSSVVNGQSACLRWEQVAQTGPSARYGCPVAYDSARGVTVQFGGALPDNSLLGDTWEWDGASWSLRTVSGPAPRSRHDMAYDSVRGVTVMFGGTLTDGSNAGDTWEWDGSVWSNRLVTGPSARGGHRMAYDSSRGVVVLFGGSNPSGSVNYGDTWEWDGSAWSLRTTLGPSARREFGLSYDSSRGVTVLFGGYAEAYLGDTWEWDGVEWTQQPVSGPTDRSHLRMAFDADLLVSRLFGGVNGDSVELDETWEWNGTAWFQSLISDPGPRDVYGLAYDSQRERLVLFGGDDGTGFRGDTWELEALGHYDTYCTTKTNSLGCTPLIGWSGVASLTGPDNYHITTSDVIGQTIGTLRWSRNSADLANPWRAAAQAGSNVCMGPAKVEVIGTSGGTVGLCDGSFDFHFSQAFMGTRGLTVGTKIYAEFFYSDPNHPDGTGIGHTNALEFQICP